MSTRLALLFLGTGTLLALTALNFSSAKIATTQTAGCPGLATDPDPTQTTAFWNNQLIAPYIQSPPIAVVPDTKQVLGLGSDDKWIEVNLTKQLLTAHDGDSIFLESPVSSGLTTKTPPGEYRIWYKAVSLKMEGGNRNRGTYYYLPNVPYAMFFKGDYGIHGTYWHNNFGTPMSHGCVNAPTSVSEKLFFWTDPQLPQGKRDIRSTESLLGTRVVVHE